MIDLPDLIEKKNILHFHFCYVGAALCSPSRYVALSGNYPHRGNRQAGTWKVNYQYSQFREGQQSIADVLKSNGYHTAMMGKW